MQTKLYSTSEDDIKEAAKVLADGGLVAFPTETVYGLGADAFDPDAARKAYAAKGRPSDNPLIVHIAKFDDLKRLVPEKYLSCTDVIKKLSDAFWPGPLTIVLPKTDKVPKETTGGLDSVAIRMPHDEATLKLIEYSGTLVSGPSANISGRPSPTSWQHVKHDLDGKIDGIICAGECEGGIESTVLSLCELVRASECDSAYAAKCNPTDEAECERKNACLKILRPGLITPEMISAATGLDVEYDEALLSKPKLDENGNAKDDPNFHPKAPGMKYRHYAPKAEMILVKAKECSSVCTDDQKADKSFDQRFDEYCKTKESEGKRVARLIPDAKNFYAALRKADEDGADLIIAKLLDDESSLSFSIMNRALKAAGYKILEI